MYEVCPRLGIVQFQPIDLSGEAKQTSHDRNTSADLFSQLSPVSELLYELTYSGNALRVKFQPIGLSDAKQTSHVIYTSAPLFFHFLLVSELLYELLLLEMLYELLCCQCA